MKRAIKLFGFSLMMTILLVGCGTSSDDDLTGNPKNPKKEYPQTPTHFTEQNDTSGKKTGPDSMVIDMLPKTQYIELTQEQKALVAKSNDFSFNLYRAIHAADNQKSNITSPLSVAYVLGMLNDGAAGNTAKEISQVLGFGATKQTINEYCKALIDQAPIADPSVILQIANIVAANQDVTLEKDFKNDMQNYYSAEVASLDFSKQSSVDYLNTWCKEKSGGMIPSIIDALSPEDLLVLMNAVYFKATWTEKFDEKDTKDEDFTKADGSTIKLPMMHRNAQIRYCINDVYTGIWLPFGSGDRWSMKVLLPEEGKTIDDIVKSLSGESWENNYWRHAIVDIKMPRFSTKSDIMLNDMVSKLGAPSIFDPQKADFSLMSKNQKQFYVSQMKQKAAIEVNEEGTKTTAVTVSMMAGSNIVNGKGEFHANRPFVYVIQEWSSGAIFFIGTFQGN